MTPEGRRASAWFLLFLIGSQEALAVRVATETNASIQDVMNGAADRSDVDVDAASEEAFRRLNEIDFDALGKLEELVESVHHHVKEWADTRPADEVPSEASLLEMQQHLDRTVLSQGGAASKLKKQDLAKAVKTLEKATQKVENINLFLCKRSPIAGYTDDGIFLGLGQDRQLENGNFEVRCSNKVNILNHGVVGDSVTGKSNEDMVKAINNLKGMTMDKYQGKAFPIKLKMCTKAGGDCKAGDKTTKGTDIELVYDENDIFGGGLTDTIPIPTELKEYLPRQAHNEDHPFAICYDDQDDCAGMMWVPKNLHTCSGWFTAEDTRVTLGQLRDAVESNMWSRWWTKSGKERLHDSLGLSKEQLPKDEQEEMELVEEAVGNTGKGKSCPLKEWQESEDQAERDDAQETLDLLTKASNLYNEKYQALQNVYKEVEREEKQLEREVDNAQRSHQQQERQLEQEVQRAQQTYNQYQYDTDETFKAMVQKKLQDATDALLAHRAGPKPQSVIAATDALLSYRTKTKPMKLEVIGPIQIEMTERQKEMKQICEEAEQEGEADDCDKANPACRQLKTQCERILGHRLQPLPCRTKEEMMELIKTKPIGEDMDHEENEGGLVELEDSQDSQPYYHRYHRRRRRSGGLFMDVLFPPYYHYHSPYMYPWYGYHGGFYAYPMIPNVGGYTFGMGTFHPGLMMIEGMGHLAFHMGRGMMYVGGAIVDGISGTGGGWTGGGGCTGDGCGYLILAIIIFIVVVIVIWLIVQAVKAINRHCSNEENCHSAWYRGGRLRTKAKKWMKLWGGIEDNVYNQGFSMLFDGQMNLEDRCVKKLQWGRKWVQTMDKRWEVEYSANKVEH